MQNDIKEYVNKIKEKQKKSSFELYKDEIIYMINEDITLKDIHTYLVEKYSISEKYVALTRWIKRNISDTKKDIKIEKTTQKKFSSKELYNSLGE